eukprot:IDg18751t1
MTFVGCCAFAVRRKLCWVQDAWGEWHARLVVRPRSILPCTCFVHVHAAFEPFTHALPAGAPCWSSVAVLGEYEHGVTALILSTRLSTRPCDTVAAAVP